MNTWKKTNDELPPEDEKVLAYSNGELTFVIWNGEYWLWIGHQVYENKYGPEFWCLIPPLPK